MTSRDAPPRQPATGNRQLTSAIERWFARHQRPLPWRRGYDPFHVWVSEVMLQQTRMEVVLGGHYDRFLERFPDVAALARASEDEVMAMWSGLGYYRRARMLRAGAIDVTERFGGRIPATVDELLTISGIGRYTAGAIASIAHGRRAPIVDGNVARIIARIDGIDAPLGSPALMREAWSRAEELVAACGNPRSFNQGLMEVGALICRPTRPLCMLCPVQRACVAFHTGRTDELPVAKAKKATRELLIPLYLILDHDGRVLMHRESGKLMTSMFHLPHGDSSLLGGTPLVAASPLLLGTFRHMVTTRRIEFALYKAELPSLMRDDDAYAWIDPHRLDEYPHPSYVRKALRLARAKSAL